MGAVLVVLFLVIPVVEIYVIVQVGQAIGALPTVLLLVLESLLGAWIVKHEGSRAWNALQEAVSTGRLPNRELADAALVLVGGTLLLTPGFVTDVFGFFFVLPVTRPLARRGLGWLLLRRARVVTVRRATWRPGGGPAEPPGRVVPGEVVDDSGPQREEDGRPEDKGPGRAAGG